MKLTTDKSRAASSTAWLPIVLTERSGDKIVNVPYYLSDTDGEDISRPSFVAGIRSAPGLFVVNPGAAVTILSVGALSGLLIAKMLKPST